MIMSKQVVIGIDGGGSYTRVAVADLEGKVLAYIRGGGANFHHNSEAEQNIQDAINKALEIADYKRSEVVALVAGLAGLDSEKDRIWAEKYTDIKEMNGPRRIVNDAKIAQKGAMGGNPGIIAICGTGSVIYGVNEEGREIRNYDFNHYAASTARHLSYELIYRIIAGQYNKEDEELVKEVLKYWEVKDTTSLGIKGSYGFMENHEDCKRKLGQMASLITSGAEAGLPLAQGVCNDAAEEVARGIRLLGSCFKEKHIYTAFIGSVIETSFMSSAVKSALEQYSCQEKNYTILKPKFSPAAGALILAYEALDIDINEKLLENFASLK
jgi:glucosamine kinase